MRDTSKNHTHRIIQLFRSVVNNYLKIVNLPKLAQEALPRLLHWTLQKHACFLPTYTNFERRAFAKNDLLGYNVVPDNSH